MWNLCVVDGGLYTVVLNGILLIAVTCFRVVTSPVVKAFWTQFNARQKGRWRLHPATALAEKTTKFCENTGQGVDGTFGACSTRRWVSIHTSVLSFCISLHRSLLPVHPSVCLSARLSVSLLFLFRNIIFTWLSSIFVHAYTLHYVYLVPVSEIGRYVQWSFLGTELIQTSV